MALEEALTVVECGPWCPQCVPSQTAASSPERASRSTVLLDAQCLQTGTALVFTLQSFSNSHENLGKHPEDSGIPESLWCVSKTKWRAPFEHIRKGNMMIKKYPFDWLERTWFFKVDFNIRMCTFITWGTTRQKRASVQRKDVCLFGSFWHHIFEVDNQRGKNQFHKMLFEVNNFSLYVSGLACYILCKAILIKRDRRKQKGNMWLIRIFIVGYREEWRATKRFGLLLRKNYADLPDLEERLLWKKREKRRKLSDVANGLYPFNGEQRGMTM